MNTKTGNAEYDAGYAARESGNPDDNAQPKLWRLGWMQADRAIITLRRLNEYHAAGIPCTVEDLRKSDDRSSAKCGRIIDNI